jgi:hypothetical protein
MTQLKEYNLKPVTDDEFNQWRQSYTSGEIPNNIMKYILDKITASENRMEVFYTDSMSKR